MIFSDKGTPFACLDGDAYEKVCYEVGTIALERGKCSKDRGLREGEAFLSKWIIFEYSLIDLRYSGYTPAGF